MNDETREPTAAEIWKEKEDERADRHYRSSEYKWFGNSIPQYASAECLMCDYILRVPIKDIVNATLPQVCPECKRKSLKFYDGEKWKSYAGLRLWDFDLFLDQQRESYAVYNNGSRHVYPIRGQEMKRILKMRCENQNQVENAVVQMDALAANGGQINKLDNRISKRDGVIWIDAASNYGEAIKITPDGWGVVGNAPLIFRHFDHMETIIVDNTGCKKDLDEYISLMNMSSEEDKIMYAGYAASLFIPEIDHPILSFFGPQGSAKTTASLMTKLLIDPSKVPLLALPDDAEKLPRIFTTHHFPVFDNCNYLSQEVSDMLCRACTGGGITARKLYTDNEEVVFVFHSPIVMNGISAPSQSPDLVDRSLIINLDRILEQNRKEKAVIEAKRDSLLPKVRGYLIGIVSDALRNGPNEAAGLPRLADFAKWADACTYAMGYQKGRFMELYTQAARDSAMEAVKSDPVIDALLTLLDGQNDWEGSASDLFRKLGECAGQNVKSASWPKDSARLSDFLNGKLKHGLLFLGWNVGKVKSNGKRAIKLWKVETKVGLNAFNVEQGQ